MFSNYARGCCRSENAPHGSSALRDLLLLELLHDGDAVVVEHLELVEAAEELRALREHLLLLLAAARHLLLEVRHRALEPAGAAGGQWARSQKIDNV